LRLGLIGRADVVEFHRVASERGTTGSPTFTDEPTIVALESAANSTAVRLRGARGLWRPYPVEYKRGQRKRGNFDRVQLCAEALCLEEMLDVSIAEGALFYGRTRRREPVSLDGSLRDETQRLAARMHALYCDRRTPVVGYDAKRCDRCSLYSLCLPKTTGSSPSVEQYIGLALG
jgi:CRISPR-associated exonuclease Cas4